MEIRDVIHGVVEVSSIEAQIVDSPFFQRLRNIKQLGFAENSYPGATHNRYSHSIGAKYLAQTAFRTIFGGRAGLLKRRPKTAERFEAVLRCAAMLHDIGHGPLSHTTEFAMPKVDKLGLAQLACLPGKACVFSGSRQADHEDYTIKIILQSSLTAKLRRALGPLGAEPIHIACVINEDIYCPDSFFVDEGIDYRPVLHQLVSSEIDVDRMDYLTRDSYYAGVNYGNFDLQWLLSHLTSHVHRNKCYLALGHKAIYAFDDFLLSRYHMFLNVYFHHKSVIFDEMLSRYFKSSDCDYEIPSDIESYIFYDDYHLYTHLSKSTNSWAKRIYHKNPFKMAAEFHSGIPQGKDHAREQKEELDRTIQGFKNRGIDYIVKTTTGELSKYFRRNERVPIFVHYTSGIGNEKFYPLEECTDLFQKYANTRSITRVYTPKDPS
ncbi:MAG TPA: HD domain-containing protein [Oligoflexia bacterium]|nr:HD domain-containing protein [Oligoflexia bacterium]